MKQDNKNNGQPVRELPGLRARIKELESALVSCKKLGRVLKESNEYIESIIDTVREPLLALDSDLRVVKANRSFYDFFKVTPQETIGNLIYGLGNRQWDIPKLRTLLEDILPKDNKFDDYEVEHEFTSIGHKIMLLNARQVCMEDACNNLVLLAIEDVTERRLLEMELKESEGRFKRLFETAKDGLLLLNKQTGDIVDVNKSIKEMLGYSSEELIGKNVQDAGLLLHIKDFKETIRELIQDGLINYEDVLTETKEGDILHTDIYLVDRARLIQCNVRDITARIHAEDAIRGKIAQLASLRVIDTAINGSLDLRVTLNILLEQTIMQLRVDAACVLLFNPYTQVLEYASGHGFSTGRITLAKVHLGEGYSGRVAKERKTIVIPDIIVVHDGSTPWHLIEDEDFKAYIGVPLIAKGQVKGVLEIFNRTTLVPDMEFIEFAEALAGQAAIALDNAEMFENLARTNSELLVAYDTTIEGWSRALDYRDKETEGHSLRVTEMAVRVCKAMGMSAEELVHVRRGALLHDIGKLGVPDSILLKPGKLTADEFAVIKKHPDFAFKLLSPIEFLHPAMDIPYCHHEKWDGSGYPRGLKGKEIPLSARIFAIIDVWDALRSDRPYRPAWTIDKTHDYILSKSGIDFDPKIVGVFLKMEGFGKQEQLAS